MLPYINVPQCDPISVSKVEIERESELMMLPRLESGRATHFAHHGVTNGRLEMRTKSEFGKLQRTNSRFGFADRWPMDFRQLRNSSAR